jgi:hypothetical protein
LTFRLLGGRGLQRFVILSSGAIRRKGSYRTADIPLCGDFNGQGRIPPVRFDVDARVGERLTDLRRLFGPRCGPTGDSAVFVKITDSRTIASIGGEVQI